MTATGFPHLGQGTVTVTGKISVDFDKDCVVNDYCVGKISNVEVVDNATARKYIDYVKVSRDTDITYTRNAEVILGDLLAIK